MRIKLSELRKFIRDSLHEDVVPDSNNEIDLANPQIIWNHTFDMSDQETSTRIANKRITIDPDIADEVDAMSKQMPQLKMLAMENIFKEDAPKGWDKAIKKMRKDKTKGKGSAKNPWSLSYWMKDKNTPTKDKKKK